MVPTDIIEGDITSHTRREIAGLFTLTATALQQFKRPATNNLDPEMLDLAHRMLTRTATNWMTDDHQEVQISDSRLSEFNPSSRSRTWTL